MTKSSVIKLPNGTTIEVSPDLSPQQITAMISALTAGADTTNLQDELSDQSASGEVIIEERDLNEIWETSKKERVALFIRSYMSDNLWFSAKDIMDQQLAVSGQIVLGETSAIGTYLARLFDGGYLDKKKSPNGRSVSYKMTDQLMSEYPAITTAEIQQLLKITR